MSDDKILGELKAIRVRLDQIAVRATMEALGWRYDAKSDGFEKRRLGLWVSYGQAAGEFASAAKGVEREKIAQSRTFAEILNAQSGGHGNG